MAVERPCVPVYVWKEAASTVEHRCWLPFVWMHQDWGMWRITNSAQQNEAARSLACAPAYLEHAMERVHTWPPLGVTRGRGKHPGAMGPHHPKSDHIFAHPVRPHTGSETNIYTIVKSGCENSVTTLH